MVVSFYDSLFSSGTHVVDEDLFQDFPVGFGENDNFLLQQIPSEQDIWEAVKGLNPNNAPAIDGYTG